MGLPLDLGFRTKGQLAIDICTDAYADGLAFDFACGDEVYGSCTQLRVFFEARGQRIVLRVASNFTLTLAAGTKLTCAEAVQALLKDKRRWEVRSAGKGSKGERWYAWAWIATASAAPPPAHPPPPARAASWPSTYGADVRDGQLLTKTRLQSSASGAPRPVGQRWPRREGLVSDSTAASPTVPADRPPGAGRGPADAAICRAHRRPSWLSMDRPAARATAARSGPVSRHPAASAPDQAQLTAARQSKSAAPAAHPGPTQPPGPLADLQATPPTGDQAVVQLAITSPHPLRSRQPHASTKTQPAGRDAEISLVS